MIMGACTGLGMFVGLIGMLTPLIAIGAILYLVLAKRQDTDLQKAH